MSNIKAFELKNGVIQETVNSQLCHRAKVIDGGYSSDEGFWASIETIDGQNGIHGRIKNPQVYDKILKAYLSKEDVAIVLPPPRNVRLINEQSI